MDPITIALICYGIYLWKKNKKTRSLIDALENNLPDKDIINLIKNGSDPNERNAFGHTPLVAAFESCYSYNVIYYLVISGADINLEDKAGFFPIIRYIRGSMFDPKVLYLFQDFGLDINKTSNKGDTPLILLICLPNVSEEEIDIVLALGADINKKGRLGYPINYACQLLKYDIVEKLIKNGALLDSCDIEGKNIFDYAKKDPIIFEIVQNHLSENKNDYFLND